MDIVFEDNKTIIKNIDRFSLHDVFESGQTFRFNGDGKRFEGVAFGRYLSVERRAKDVILYPCPREDFENIWKHYFDLDRDYDNLFENADEYLKEGMDYGKGLRILNQYPFETLISFIISANNNIKRIKGIVSRLCEKYGESFEFEGREFYKFPTAEVLAAANEDDLKAIGLGYRAPYIKKTAVAVNEGFSLEEVQAFPYIEAKKKLCTLMGVGPKVADCILLFSMEKSEAFPADVWIKRVLERLYGFKGTDKQTVAFALEKFGKNAGFAQQYLFFWARENMREA